MAKINEIELKIPNLGEAEDTEIIELSVKPGDKVKVNDPIIVLESEKAAMEVPSDYDGEIISINVTQGENVREGMVFAVIKTAESEMPKVEKEEVAEQKVVAQESKVDEKTVSFDGINAGPAVRKIARELEIDLTKILGSGKNQLITKQDLKNFIHSLKQDTFTSYFNREELYQFGEYEIIKQSKVRAIGAKNLQQSWQAIPHVTHFEEAEITQVELIRKKLNENSEIKITPLAFFIKSIASSLVEHPIFNSSLIGEAEILIRKYVNIGVAVDTDVGLIVPVIKDADKLAVEEIAKKIIELSSKAKSKKLLKNDMEGATFTVSSLGAMGGTGFTPIINPPEVGIVGISRVKKNFSVENGEISEKLSLPLTLSYDHRVINGADAGKFMLCLKDKIESGKF